MPFHPTRRQVLAGAPAAWSAASARGQAGSAAANRPNIVLVISDQFRWDCIGAMGLNPMNLTPNLDPWPAAACCSGRHSATSRSAPRRAAAFSPASIPAGTACGGTGSAWREDATTLATGTAAGRILGQLHRQVAPRAERRTVGGTAPGR